MFKFCSANKEGNLDSFFMEQFRVFIASIFLILAMVSTPKALAEETTTVAIGEWAPFFSKDLPEYGIGSHLITAAFAKVGIKVEYLWYPWTRSMNETADSKADFTGLWLSTDERRQRFSYSTPVIFSKAVFFYNKEQPFEWDSLESFPQNIVVGTARGYSYGAAFDDAAKEGKVKTSVATTEVQNIKKLVNKRIGAFVSDEIVGRNTMKQNLTADEIALLEVHPKALSSDGMHLLTAKNNSRGNELLKKFNEGMELLTSSGEFDKIMGEYQ